MTESKLKAIQAEWNQIYKNTTKPGYSCVYQLAAKKNSVGRIEINRQPENLDTPLLVVFRQRKDISSFAVPINIENYLYISTARTLNPFKEDQLLFIEISSDVSIHFSFRAYLLQDEFHIPLDKTVEVYAAVAKPVFYLVTIPNGTDSVSVHVNSNTTSCVTISVQPENLQVSDQSNTVFSNGMYQTMTQSATITVLRQEYPQFYVVFVLKPNDRECSEMPVITPASGHLKPSQVISKHFNVTMESKMKESEYIFPIACMAFMLLIISMYYMRFEMFYDGSDSERFTQFRDDMRIQEHPYILHPRDDESLSSSYDYLEDAVSREIIRAKTQLMIADLAMKTYTERNDKYKQYAFYITIIALFYLLPTVQLVLHWSDNLRMYGNLDLCWYNFRCARPFLCFFAFNNIISNSAYVILGALLIIMTYVRHSQYSEEAQKEPSLEEELGLPQHPGLMYAIGIAIVMEGLLSASYHVCPSETNYQFDTSFMYVIASLGMLKIYQLRHPDIIAHAHVTIGIMAGFIFIAMLGVRWHALIVWIIFPIVYTIIMLGVSIEFYFKGVWKVSFKEMKVNLGYAWASSRWSCWVPKYKGRFFFLALANLLNIAFLIFGIWKRPPDFASFLLYPFMANLLFYFLYYCVMKLSYREKIGIRAIIFLIIGAACWGSSFYFFFHLTSDWSKTPAQSRELNSPCIIANFFDNHDVWHFLSALAMFISFSLLDRIDDDLRFTDRAKIPVF